MSRKSRKITSLLLAILLVTNVVFSINVFAETEEESDEVFETSESTDSVPSEEPSVDEATEEGTSEEVVFVPVVEPIDITQMEKVTENNYLELYIDRETTEIAVKEKGNGHVWYSNPADRANDTVASGENRGLLNSLLVLSYYNIVGQTTRMDSYKDSVMKDQVEFEDVDDGIKIIYSFGESSKGLDQLPQYISKERFETLILDRIEDEATRKDIAKRYKYIEEEEMYERRDASFPIVILERTVKLLEEIGYTEEDLAFDNAEHLAEEEESGHPFFVIPLTIQLENDNLVVTVEGEAIEFNETYPLANLHIMPFFGAANDSTEGYILVPDGSGALIHLNNGKSNYQPFNAPVYGVDKAIFERTNSLVSETIRLPVYGMKQEDNAFLAIIEEGDGIASIRADVAGRLNAYNNVFSVFTIKESGEVTLSGGDRSSTVSIFQKGQYNENISVRYGFLNGENANYAGMAKYYQDYLVEMHGLQPLQMEENVPFFLDLTGSIWKRKTFLGVPYKSLQPLTTFEEAEEILNELMDQGVGNIKLRYTGWFNEGIDHKIPTKINVDNKIGGEKGLNEFAKFLDDHDIEFYPDVAFQHVYRNTLGFSPSRDASRFITRRIAQVYPFNPASSRRDVENRTPFHVLSPTKLPTYVDKFLDDYQSLNIEGLSLRDLGDELNSDFREKKVVNREEAKKIVEEQVEKISGKVPNLIAYGGNSMVLPYTKAILGAPLSSSEFNITDRSVPFYQMVIRGYVDYAGTPINLKANQSVQYQLLKSLETGSNVYFQWFYENPAMVKDTEFDHMFSSNYSLWMNDAVEMYVEVNNVLSEVQAEPITSHELLADGVIKTTYGNKLSVIVNYNDRAVAIDGVTIDAEGYMVQKGE